MNVKSDSSVVVKSEPDWSLYRSSFDDAHQNYTPVQSMMTNQPAVPQLYPQQPVIPANQSVNGQAGAVNSPTKRKGKQRKIKAEPGMDGGISVKQEQITDTVKVKKKRDRFKGTTEEEVLQRVLPDHIQPGLDILIIGINPGLTAAYIGHHYAGPGNHFWKCLFLSGLVPQQMNCYDDYKLSEYGIGFTNIVERTSRGSADLTKKEIKEGGEILLAKVQKYKPKIAVFNGKGIYEVFVGHKKFHIGKQPDPFPGCESTAVFVMPSSSARFTQLPRAIDKVPFYLALKKYRDHISGRLPELKEEEVYFPDLNLKVVPKAERLAEIARQEAESGQLLVKPEAKLEAKLALQDGETKPKRGRKKNKEQNVCVEAAAYNVVNEPCHGVVIKPEPGTQQSCPNSTHNSEEPSVEEMLANGGTLVKQEDVSELAKFGINTHHLQTSSALMSATARTTSTTGEYWGGHPYLTQAQGFATPSVTYSQAIQQNSQPLNTGYHIPGNGMAPVTTGYHIPGNGITPVVTSGYHNPSTSMAPVTSGYHNLSTGLLPAYQHNGYLTQAGTAHFVQGGAGQSMVGQPVNPGPAIENRILPTESFNQFKVKPSSQATHSQHPSEVSTPSQTGSSPGGQCPPRYTVVKEKATQQTASHPYLNQFSGQS